MTKKKDTKNKKIKALITGCSGFIGRHLAKALIDKGWEVYALVRKSTDTSRLPGQVLPVQADYSDSASLKKAVTGMDYVFHVGAALKAPDFETFFKANAVSTNELAAACVESNTKLKKFVYVSSMAAVGPSGPGRLKTEKDENSATSLYGQSKLAGEEFLKNFAGKLPYVIVRPPNVLGTGQEELKTVIKFANMRLLPQLGNGDKQISIIFVEDLVRAVILVAESDKVAGEAYLVTDNQVHSWRDLIYAVAEEMGKTPYVLKIPFPVLYMIAVFSELAAKITRGAPLLSMADLMGVRRNYWLFDSRKIQQELGFEPRIELRRGLREVVEYYRAEKVIT